MVGEPSGRVPIPFSVRKSRQYGWWPGRALAAGAAAAVAEHHVVAGPDARHVCAHSHDHARALVAEHDRRDRLRPDRLHRQVALADADGAQLHEHLVAAGLIELDLGDLERRRGACREGSLDLHRT